MKLVTNNIESALGAVRFKALRENVAPLFSGMAKDVADAKAKIDNVSAIKQWDRIKKRTNPYELIYNSNSWNKKSNSVAKYLAMSRSFYKLWEMMFDYDLLVDFEDRSGGSRGGVGEGGARLVSANLAEGPGGFIEAIIKYRGERRRGIDKYFGITLKPTSRYIPSWEKIKGDKFSDVHTLFGSLYSPKVVAIYRDIVMREGGAHIVTADGGFDYSVDFNQQERMSYHLIFAEIVTALIVQRVGGHFVCKVFDIFDVFSLKCIYLLTFFYREVRIVKPKTSRPANSEKYVVAKGFIGLSGRGSGSGRNGAWIIECLRDFEKAADDKSVHGFDLEGIELSPEFIEEIREFNKVYCGGQIDTINKTLEMIDKKLPQDDYNSILQEQHRLAIEWCRTYHVSH